METPEKIKCGNCLYCNVTIGSISNIKYYTCRKDPPSNLDPTPFPTVESESGWCGAWVYEKGYHSFIRTKIGINYKFET